MVGEACLSVTVGRLRSMMKSVHWTVNSTQYIIIKNGILKLNSTVLPYQQGIYFTVHSLRSIRAPVAYSP